MAGFSRKQTLESFTGYVKEIPDRASKKKQTKKKEIQF